MTRLEYVTDNIMSGNEHNMHFRAILHDINNSNQFIMQLKCDMYTGEYMYYICPVLWFMRKPYYLDLGDCTELSTFYSGQCENVKEVLETVTKQLGDYEIAVKIDTEILNRYAKLSWGAYDDASQILIPLKDIGIAKFRITHKDNENHTVFVVAANNQYPIQPLACNLSAYSECSGTKEQHKHDILPIVW